MIRAVSYAWPRAQIAAKMDRAPAAPRSLLASGRPLMRACRFPPERASLRGETQLDCAELLALPTSLVRPYLFASAAAILAAELLPICCTLPPLVKRPTTRRTRQPQRCRGACGVWRDQQQRDHCRYACVGPSLPAAQGTAGNSHRFAATRLPALLPCLHPTFFELLLAAVLLPPLQHLSVRAQPKPWAPSEQVLRRGFLAVKQLLPR